MQIIDLSVLINEQTPAYPGDPTITIEPAGILLKDGYVDHSISIGTHIGTHIDAPMHMVKNGVSLDKIPIEQFVGRGKCINIEREFNLENIKAAGIQAGDIVLFYTGMGDHYFEPIYFEEYPAMSEAVADYLVQQNVKMVGLDTGSADNLEDFPIHKKLLAGDVLIIENLTNLAPLVDKNFIVYALPLKLDIDGAPARVIAVVQE